MPILSSLAWRIFQAADATIVRTGIRKSRVGRESLAGLNRFGTGLVRVWVLAHGHPFQIHGHQMYLANSGGPSVAFTVSMILDRYETGTTRLVERILKPGMVFLDVGAHAGYFSLLAARQVGPHGSVFAFEPAPTNFELLQRNIALNGYKNISAFPIAGAENSARMKLSLDAKGNDRHSLVLVEEPGSMQNTVEVDTISIDDFLERSDVNTVDLMKIDAEGAECAILRGLRRSLTEGKVRRLVFEFSPSACEAAGIAPDKFLTQMADFGFRLYRIEGAEGLIRISGSNVTSLVDQVKAKGACNFFAEQSKLGEGEDRLQ